MGIPSAQAFRWSLKFRSQLGYRCKSCWLHAAFRNLFLPTQPQLIAFQIRIPWKQRHSTCSHCPLILVGEGVGHLGPSLGSKEVLSKDALILSYDHDWHCFWWNTNAGCGLLLMNLLRLWIRVCSFSAGADGSTTWKCRRNSFPIINMKLDHLLVSNNIKIDGVCFDNRKLDPTPADEVQTPSSSVCRIQHNSQRRRHVRDHRRRNFSLACRSESQEDASSAMWYLSSSIQVHANLERHRFYVPRLHPWCCCWRR